MDNGEFDSIRPQNQEAEDLAQIEAILSRDGIREALTEFMDDFKQQPGEELLSGITADGLVVAVREDREEEVYLANKPGYFTGWVLNATLSPEEMQDRMIKAPFSVLNVSMARDGGSVTLEKQILPNQDPLLDFLQATGGFSTSSPLHPQQPILGNNKKLYPLNLPRE